jgi:PAS domain S-box-containing protein
LAGFERRTAKSEAVMSKPLQVLIVEDSTSDAAMVARLLRKAGYNVHDERVDSAGQMRAALEKQAWDVVIADYSLPQFDAPAALALLQETGLDIPFIVVSGSIGEEVAVAMMKAGADDYLLKDKLSRLAPAVEREIHEAKMRRERKQFEEALVKERNLIRTLIDNLPDLIFFKDLESRFVLVNQALLQMGQQTMAEVIGKTDFEINPPELAARYYADDQAVIHSGQPIIDREERNISAGQTRWFSTTKVPLRDKEGQIIGLVGMSRDITEQKRAEEARRELAENMAEAQRLAHFGSWEIRLTEDLEIVDPNLWSDECYRILGFEPGAVASTQEFFQSHVHPDDRDSMQQALFEAIQNHTEWSYEYRLVRSDGAIRYIHDQAKVVLDEYTGRPVKVVGTIHDITERKQAEMELEQRAVQLALINNISAQVTAVLELDRLLDQVASLIHHMFDYHHVALFLIEGEVLKLKAVAGLYTAYFPAGHTQRLDVGIIGRVASSGEKIVANDVSQEPYYISLIAAHSITRSELCIPLSIAGQTIGALDIQSPQLNGFSQNDVIAMEALTHQLAGAIANAHSYEQARREISERQRVEAEISARNRELTLLNQIIAISLGDEEVETILETTCSELARAFNMAQVTASLLNEEKSELVVVARYASGEAGLSETPNGEWLTTPGARMAIDRHNPVARALLNQSGPLVAAEAQNDPRLVFIHETLRRLGIVSLLVLPLQVEGEVLGSLNLEAAQPHFFSAEEVALAWSVADQVAGALIRIRLEQKRDQAEAEVRASEERFRQVIASISDHIYLSEIAADGRHFNLYISPNVEQLTGYPMEKFTSDATFWPTVVIHPDDRAIAAGQLSRLQQGQNSEVEYRLMRADGQIVWVRDNGRVVPQAGSVLIYGVVSDITERKRAELTLLEERALLAQRVAERTAELSAANAQLARAAQLKDEFLANMSHELRTPLNAILGMSEILREHSYGPLNEEQLNSIGHIEEGGRHLLALINDILDLSKIEAGKLELSIAPVSVENVCQASLRFIKQIAQKKQIAVSFALDPTISTIRADERRLKQILVNLLTNAVKFTPEGGQVKLEVVNDLTGEKIYFNVHDSGIGIAPEDMERLFKPFTQLVFRLTELHGGSVKVESTPNRGSKFMVSLPCPVETGQLEPIPEPAILASGSSDYPELQRVLIVEDSPAAAEQLTHYLAEGSIETIIQPTGTETVAQALAYQPQVIILDVMLPDLSGWDVLAQLKANPATQNIPVLIVSVVDERSHGLELGAAEYLVKPVSRTQLWQAMHQILSTQVTPGFKKPLILLAEDNEANINTLSPYLQAKGYRLKLARNGSQAIQMALEEGPEVILMDIQMPVMDGLEAIRQLRANQQFAGVPIIALTALAMPGDRERCLAAGANEYLSKPVSLKGLVELIEYYLQQTPSPAGGI